MRGLITIAVAFCWGVQCARAVTLLWDANLEPDIASYNVHWGDISGTPANARNVGNVTTTVIDEPWAAGVTIFFTVTAINTDGLESLPSNEVAYTVPPPPPPPGPAPSPPALRVELHVTYHLWYPPGSTFTITGPAPPPGWTWLRWTGDTEILDNFLNRKTGVTIPYNMDTQIEGLYGPKAGPSPAP